MSKNALLFSLLGGVAAVIGGGILLLYLTVFPASLEAGDGKIVTIQKGQTTRQIAQTLKAKKLIKSPRAFYIYIRYRKLGHKLKAGSFLLRPNQSLMSIGRDLTEKNGVAEMVKVTIPEGFSIAQISQVLAKKELVDEKAFQTYAHTQAKKDFIPRYSFLKNLPVHTLEGYLFPETYFFPKVVDAKQVVDTMLKQFDKQIYAQWQAAEALKGSPKKRFNLHQVLTIGSLIQKEARVQDEMTTISAVFYNRLRKRMALASDPTVVYALGQGYKRKVYYKDLKIDSPYNTYKYSGFPPSPIAAVGAKAFAASLAPRKVSYLFFVATKGGRHTFTNTYKEHLRAQGY